MKAYIKIIGLLPLFFAGFIASSLSAGQPIVIAFGSCNHQDAPQPMWKHILAEDPSVWIWLGDNIYGDTTDMSVMRAKYDKNKSQPDYVTLREKVDVFGTWDDHDYGKNDGGKEYTAKEASKAEFIRFMDIPDDHEIHSHEGIYHSADIVRQGMKIRIIMLDTRTFRDPIVRKKEDGWMFARYQPNYEGTMLGEAQWKWLETQLAGADFDFCIIGSSIQLIAEEHAFEKWANFPKERVRLLDLIAINCPGKAVVISGDRHHSEISKLAIENTGKAILDITSSGLTQRGGLPEETNRHRVGPFNGKINYGLIKIDPIAGEATYEIKGIDRNVISSYTQKL
jgi:alkaline phosphatase D